MTSLRSHCASGALVLIAIVAATFSGGCQWVPKNQLTAAQAQSRALAEERNALLAENQNLKALREKFVDQQVDMEQQLAQLDAQVGLESRRVANYRNERDALKGQFDGLIKGASRVPAGESRRYGISGVLLAQAAGQRPVVPVAHNAGEFWPRRGLLKKPGTIRVIIGRPIPTAGREARDVIDDVRGWIETTLRRISAESR